MELQTKNITLDEFKEWAGIDLQAQMRGDDNPSATAQAFLNREAYRLETFIDSAFYRNVKKEYPNFTDYQKEHYKHALMEQILYVFKNGDISVDSGYDPDDGVKASTGTLNEKSIAPNARRELMLCGLWCREIRNHGRNAGDVGPIWWGI